MNDVTWKELKEWLESKGVQDTDIIAEIKIKDLTRTDTLSLVIQDTLPHQSKRVFSFHNA